jgi:hypothetical protein
MAHGHRASAGAVEPTRRRAIRATGGTLMGSRILAILVVVLAWSC